MKKYFVVLLDTAAIAFGLAVAFFLRFEFSLNAENQRLLFISLPLAMVGYMLPFWGFRLYSGIWRYSSFSDLIRIIKAVTLGAVLTSGLVLFLNHGNYPRSVLVFSAFLTFLFVCGVRFAIRLYKHTLERPAGLATRKALIVGAGDMGESLLRQLLSATDQSYQVVGFIDDNPAKRGRRIHGHTVLGGRQMLGEVLTKNPVDEVIIAITARRGEIVSSVVEALSGLSPRPELKIAPSFQEMLRSPGLTATRQVRPADLLNRDVVHLDQQKISLTLKGKTVLVTGAGGTIGSELCRQVLRYGAAKVLALENHATSLFYIEAELKEKARGQEIIPVLGDVRNRSLLDRIFGQYRPQIVFHAAAHKHVHQLESNIQEGVSNNLLGTYGIASAASSFGAEACLLISTDKAVWPQGVMGATKRAAEVIIGSFAAASRTRFSAVRFGNVLGSSGSALQIFQEQISKGGPVTVTDVRATRYFMTVEEAVGLILQAVSMARGGDMFVLRMGVPVRIIDMAKNLIRLSGFEPGREIEIREIGLRPGEKLEEQLVENEDEMEPSAHPDIMKLRADPPLPMESLKQRLLDMEIACHAAEESSVLRHIHEIVPTFSNPSAPFPGVRPSVS